MKSVRSISCKAPSESGFSLLEMIVVLSVISMMAVVGLAGINGSNRKTTAAKTLTEVQTIIYAARSSAISRSRQVVLEFDLERNIVLEEDVQVGLLSEDLKFQFTGASELTDERKTKFLFNPDGSSTGGTIQIADSFGNQGSLVINWVTGIPRVEKDSE